MTRLSILSLVACAIAVAVALSLGGTRGNGVLMGFGAGAGFSGLGVLYQRHTMLVRPERSMNVFMILAMVKLAIMFVVGVSLRYLEAGATLADWKSFMLTYALAVALIVPLGSFEAVRNLHRPQGSDPLKP